MTAAETIVESVRPELTLAAGSVGYRLIPRRIIVALAVRFAVMVLQALAYRYGPRLLDLIRNIRGGLRALGLSIEPDTAKGLALVESLCAAPPTTYDAAILSAIVQVKAARATGAAVRSS